MMQVGPPNHNDYNTSQSPTYQAQQATFNVRYSDGSTVSGQVGADTVVIGETTVTGQWFGLPSEVPETLLAGAEDGILGLAFSTPLNTSMSPFSRRSFKHIYATDIS
jgi:aspergillopepsin I